MPDAGTLRIAIFSKRITERNHFERTLRYFSRNSPDEVILLALDQGLWDCERSLAELAALCEANHMEAVAEVTQKRQTPETGIVLGSGKLEEAAAAAAELGAECASSTVS